MPNTRFNTDVARQLLVAAQPTPFALLDANGHPRLDQDRKCVGCGESALSHFDHAPGCGAASVAKLFDGQMNYARRMTHGKVCSALLAAIEEVELLRLQVIGLESQLGRSADVQA